MAPWIVILITLVFAAFLSGMEIAFLSANKLRIELESKQRNISAKIFSFFLKHPARFIATALVGTNIAIVIYSIYMDSVLEPVLYGYVSTLNLGESAQKVLMLGMSAFISTVILLFTAEFLPKSLFRINSNGVLSFFAVPYQLIYYILSPIVFITTSFSEFILARIFGVRISKESISFGKIDLDNYVRQVTDTSEEEEKEIDHEIRIFQNALSFSDSKVRDAMIPRTEVVAIEVNSSLEVLHQKFIETRLSKILVYEGNIDKMIGYVYSYDLFKKPKNIRSILWPINIVPETLLLKDVLKIFISQHKSIAVVVDEFGGTSGLLTIEDVIEEIFGEIEDEHDEEELIERKLAEDEFVFSGRHEIDYLNDEYGIDLPVSEEYETLAGMLIYSIQRIPEAGETLRIGNFEFEVLAVSNARVDKIHLKLLPDTEE